jgi:hypothetical protein
VRLAQSPRELSSPVPRIRCAELAQLWLNPIMSLVKGLQLAPETIIKPLIYSKERWSGEKMILLPSMIHEDLDREKIVQGFGGSRPKRPYGIVALTPGFNWTKDWKAYGAVVADKDTVSGTIEKLRTGKYEHVVVLANRYDGIDLPDDTCRILIFDSKPYSESLTEASIIGSATWLS